ncbi:uncharacterized protein LOC125042937 [Penaeus chinensis]|uniref:uncharacterized protein LOC125042937 n=1 Tax=Penaeus chinensis TaxID=139456 RepID=UPI001FB83C57|nr:uncharacterized protein LOC125042937 [Penaeus chinensis]
MVVSDLARSGSVCLRVDRNPGSPPPPVIVKVHLKKHLRENPALLSVIDEVERRRNDLCRTPTSICKSSSRNFPNSVKKAFAQSNRIGTPCIQHYSTKPSIVPESEKGSSSKGAGDFSRRKCSFRRSFRGLLRTAVRAVGKVMPLCKDKISSTSTDSLVYNR